MDLSRTEILVGKNGMQNLARAHVAVIGIGGVGGYALEALARAGIGNIVIVDHDVVAPSNLNRQIYALHSTIGKPKIEVAEARIKDINPEAHIKSFQLRINASNIGSVLSDDITHAIDAIDEIDAKVNLIIALISSGMRFVSCMGAGSKLDPGRVHVADISKTRYCPLARSVRQRLKKNGISSGVRCVYSEENLKRFELDRAQTEDKTVIQGTISYMPALFGMYAAGEIIRDILNIN